MENIQTDEIRPLVERKKKNKFSFWKTAFLNPKNLVALDMLTYFTWLSDVASDTADYAAPERVEKISMAVWYFIAVFPFAAAFLSIFFRSIWNSCKNSTELLDDLHENQEAKTIKNLMNQAPENSEQKQQLQNIYKKLIHDSKHETLKMNIRLLTYLSLRFIIDITLLIRIAYESNQEDKQRLENLAYGWSGSFDLSCYMVGIFLGYMAGYLYSKCNSQPEYTVSARQPFPGN